MKDAFGGNNYTKSSAYMLLYNRKGLKSNDKIKINEEIMS